MSLLLDHAGQVVTGLTEIYMAARKDRTTRRRAVIGKKIAAIQFERTAEALEEGLLPLFNAQIATAAKELADRGGEKASRRDALALADQIFNPGDWREPLVDHTLPYLAQGMIDASFQQYRLLGAELGKSAKSTATEWLNNQGEDVSLDETGFDITDPLTGKVRRVVMRIATEYPAWMLTTIEANLQEIFAADFWDKVAATTSGDITSYLERGLREGWSIEKMAKEMEPFMNRDGAYARKRGRTIARTESGHALNGARNMAIDDVLGDFEEGAAKMWLSVLGTTTRNEHAMIDGVPADKNGFWFLSGYQCRWPSDVNLPVKHRANCQCTIHVELGLTNAESDAIIGDYQSRVDAYQEEESR